MQEPRTNEFEDIDDAESLYYEPTKRFPMLIENLLPSGLSIFCGASKIGKSWLMLWLCLQVAKGQPIWDRNTTQTDVLYLALEDTRERIKSRIRTITDEPVPTLRFRYRWPSIGEGFEEKLERFLSAFPRTGLVVIDTLQKIRTVTTGSFNAYSHDYHEISILKDIADKHNICILLVHHLRKLSDSSDPFNEVSGSTGIAGAADTTMIMKKQNRFSDNATLYVAGRDVEQQEFTLQFKNNLWHLIESAGLEELQRKQTPDFLFRVVDFMQEKDCWKGTASELLAQMGITDLKPNVASKYLAQYYYEVLYPAIEFSTERNWKQRIITLRKPDGQTMDSAPGETP